MDPKIPLLDVFYFPTLFRLLFRQNHECFFFYLFHRSFNIKLYDISGFLCTYIQIVYSYSGKIILKIFTQSIISK
jgi:hypothetical protein